jgi:hypothetical protein
MNAATCRVKADRKADSQSKAALGRYLAAGLGATGLASVECEAAVVNLNIANLGSNNVNLTGANAGIPSGGQKTVNDFVVAGRDLQVANVFGGYKYTGFISDGGAVGGVAFATGVLNATPTKFVDGGSVSSAENFTKTSFESQFYLSFYGIFTAGNFSSTPANYIGFRVAANGTSPFFNNATLFNYGYFQVTWNSTSKQFQILSGAYESTANTPITIVPEPGSMALAGIGALALGAGAIRRSRKARKAAADGAVTAAV